MHLVWVDAPGATVELRLTARDRAAYAAGIPAATDWLRSGRRAPARQLAGSTALRLVGVHAFGASNVLDAWTLVDQDDRAGATVGSDCAIERLLDEGAPPVALQDLGPTLSRRTLSTS
jgi:hypothetical protein